MKFGEEQDGATSSTKVGEITVNSCFGRYGGVHAHIVTFQISDSLPEHQELLLHFLDLS